MIVVYAIIGWPIFVLLVEAVMFAFAAVLIKKPSLSWHDFIEMYTSRRDREGTFPFTLPVWVGIYATIAYWIIVLKVIFRR